MTTAGFENLVALVQRKENDQIQAKEGFENVVALAERERSEPG